MYFPPENTSKLRKVQKDFDPSNTRLHLNRNLQLDNDNKIMEGKAEPNSLETPQDSQETSDSERQVIKYFLLAYFQTLFGLVMTYPLL